MIGPDRTLKEPTSMSREAEPATSAVLISKEDLPFLALFLGTLLILFSHFFLSKQTIYARDSAMLEIPIRKHCSQLLREGNLALWTDAYSNGAPFLANPKNAVLYPTTWLYLFMPFFSAFKLHYFLSILFGWLGLFVLFKSYGLGRRAAFLGASLFVFSGMYLSSVEFYNHVAAISWMPWVLLMLAKASSARSLQGLFAAAFFWALMILAGAPEFVIMTVGLAVAQACFDPRSWRTQMGFAALSLLIAVLLTAVQVLPMLELLFRSERASIQTEWPLEILQLTNLGFPNILGGDRVPGLNEFWGRHLFDRNYPLYYSLYMGAATFVLMSIGLKRPGERKKRPILIVAAIFFLISCGYYSPFYFIVNKLPIINAVRYPVKFFMVMVFALSFLAAMGFQELEDHRGGRRARASPWLFVACIASLLYWIFKKPILSCLDRFLVIDNPVSMSQLARSLETGLLLFLASAFLTFLSGWRRGPKLIALAIFMVIAIADPVYHNRSVNPTISEAFFDPPRLLNMIPEPRIIHWEEPAMGDLRVKPPEIDNHLHLSRDFLKPLIGLYYGIRYVMNGDLYSLNTAAQNLQMKLLRQLSPQQRAIILRELGCSLVVSKYRPDLPESRVQGSLIDSALLTATILDPAFGPRLIVYWETASSIDNTLARLLDDDFSARKKGIINEHDSKGLVASAESDAGSYKVSVIRNQQGLAVYETTASSEALLIVPGNFSPGWKARIDGARAEVFEANIFSKAVVVPAGTHNIVMRYMPDTFVVGFWTSLASLIGIVMTLILRAFIRRGQDL